MINWRLVLGCHSVFALWQLGEGPAEPNPQQPWVQEEVGLENEWLNFKFVFCSTVASFTAVKTHIDQNSLDTYKSNECQCCDIDTFYKNEHNTAGIGASHIKIVIYTETQKHSAECRSRRQQRGDKAVAAAKNLRINGC